jgi:hypothetical protein
MVCAGLSARDITRGDSVRCVGPGYVARDSLSPGWLWTALTRGSAPARDSETSARGSPARGGMDPPVSAHRSPGETGRGLA